MNCVSARVSEGSDKAKHLHWTYSNKSCQTLFEITNRTLSGSCLQVLPAQVKHLTWKCVSCTRTTSPLQTSRHLWQRIGPEVLSLPPEPWWADEADKCKDIQLVLDGITHTGLIYCSLNPNNCYYILQGLYSYRSCVIWCTMQAKNGKMKDHFFHLIWQPLVLIFTSF